MAGKISYAMLAALYSPELAAHRARAAELGFDVAPEVFEQLVYETHLDWPFALSVATVDWAGVRFREGWLSGEVLAQVTIAREFEHAVEAARLQRLANAAVEDGVDEWAGGPDPGSWRRPPVLVTGEVLDQRVSYALVVGHTRLGALLSMLERGEMEPARRHRVWIGERG